jgi:glucose-6-phosphate 1-dehydrogenase
MTQTQAAFKATLVIFGAMGELRHRLLMPSLIKMTAAGRVGDALSVIGIGRAEGDDESLRRSFERFHAAVGSEGVIDRSDGRERAAWTSLCR